jgi:hypothetical protein
MHLPAARSAKPTKSPSAKKSQLLPTTATSPQHQQDGDSADESAAQHKRKASSPEPQSEPSAAAPRPVSPHQRQGDRSSSDDAAPRLPTYVRFADLRAAGIVSNWPQLYNLIDDYCFPEGVLLSPNTRAWRVADI